MIVCSCFAVSDRQIRSAADRGATTPREVARACHAGSGCGSCLPTVRTILDEARKPQAQSADDSLDAPGLQAAG